MSENKLIHENSPYLLQHAKNPVQWYPWGKEALEKARNENKPIFLSIGYSSCHWCHVMAHESFEDEEVAKVMNENFVNIKVDREERPDIDDIYQKVNQMATGMGGWPLSVFLTPDQKPFYVGTYFPRLDMYGRPGFGSILRQLAQAWREKPEDVKKTAENFVENLQKTETVTTPSTVNRQLLDEAAVNLLQMGDPVNGGFGSAPKFPNAANVSFLFRYSNLSEISKFREFGLMTLKKMAKGGIFDQIGGGFHRYSTDSKWLVPHFEKMLYDNALIPINYAEAYQITKDPFYLDIMKMTLDYILREMTSKEGGFYSAQDADSEGVEGKYYVWTKKEIKEILGDDSDVFCLYYDVTDGGNWEGKTILCNNINLSSVAFKLGKTEDEVKKILEDGRNKLLDQRSKRISPGLDDKVLTAWNGLMISAFAAGYRVTGEEKYLDAAKNCVSFIQNRLMQNGELLRSYKDGNAKIPGYLDDYAYFINALLDVFEINPDESFLNEAKRLADYLAEHFWDEEHGSFFMNADNHEDLIIRPKSNYDLSVPSGNSVAAFAFLKLFHITQDERLLNTATKIMESQGQMAAENPFAFGMLLNAMYLYVVKPTEITVLNTENQIIYDYLRKEFIPAGIIIMLQNKEQLDKLKGYPFFEGKEFGQKTSAYVCKNFTCSLPLSTLEEIKKQL